MIYIVIGIYLLALAIQFDFRGKGSAATRKFHFRLAFLILVALMAFRYRVGGDTLRYMDSYEHMYGAIDTFDIGGRLQPLWLLLNNFLHSISPKFLLFQIVHVLFINTVFFSFFKKYSKYLFVAIFLYYIQYGGNPGIFRNRLLPALHRCLPAETMADLLPLHRHRLPVSRRRYFPDYRTVPFQLENTPFIHICHLRCGSRRLAFFSKHVFRQHLHALE